ncbi:tRNA wybutosine-synthesizing protein 2 [Nakaseomyces bracarensis]|uniref:tRNA wybutosine-synthesizing protein 2 n=1 Tax=Nakaseomyces bracarensis TaxID=273131 RepID=A0ABR4NMW4_9SACH
MSGRVEAIQITNKGSIGSWTFINMVVEILVDDTSKVKALKTELEQSGLFSKPIYNEDQYKVIRTTVEDINDPRLESFVDFKFRISDKETVEANKGIVGFTTDFLRRHGVDSGTVTDLVLHLPQKYTVFTPLLLFNYSKEKSFLHGPWSKLSQEVRTQYFAELIDTLFRSQRITHVATNMPIIESDIMRRPFNLVPLYGEKFRTMEQDRDNDSLWDSPTTEDFLNALWCHVTQNGIEQSWAPLFTMFSRGNIKEKKRILDSFQDIEGNDVIDMYSGIGYFTLSYLKRGARNVFAFELNPWSTEGLRRGLVANKFSKNRCHIYNESNEMCLARLRQFIGLEDSPTLRIRHINLGLLPSSTASWPLALQCCEYQRSLLPDWEKTTLHIHENVHIDLLDSKEFIHSTVHTLNKLNPSFHYSPTHLEKIKTFAPDIWHICLDVDVLYQKGLV